MVWSKRARPAETPKQPSLDLPLRAPYFYPDGAADKAAKSGEVEVLAPSIARFRRLAYPLRSEVTTCEMRGRRSHGCPAPRGAAEERPGWRANPGA